MKYRTQLACTLRVLMVGLVFGPFLPAQDDVSRRGMESLTRNCVSCHGQTPMSALDLRHRESALKGGTRGPAVIPGNAKASLLYQAASHSGALKMPPGQPSLPIQDLEALRQWIDQGFLWDSPALQTQGQKSVWWSFQSLNQPPVPKVDDLNQRNWARNEIDQFVLARLARENLAPSPEADRFTLIRRVSLDLTGLPPAWAEVEAFVTDRRPDAYERVVDGLLSSPHYGERWGRHWLDLARYADSNGGEIDKPRSIWKYRDWVIDALNRDVPFDQFVVDQIAGDLLPGATQQQRIATGFHCNTIADEVAGNGNPEVARLEAVIDRVNTTGVVFSGLTLGCAQCHSHKFDPISMRDYYQLLAFFNDADCSVLELAPAAEIARRDAIRSQQETLRAELKTYEKALVERFVAWEQDLIQASRTELKPEIRAILETPRQQRSEKQKQTLLEFFKGQDPGYQQRLNTIEELSLREPKLVSTLVTKRSQTPRTTQIFIRGDFQNKGAEVSPGVPEVLPPMPEVASSLGGHSAERPDRLDLARWLVSAENPLTARVTVNRIWQQHFGQGLVETESDFGTRGSLPSHPELLDWLACEFRDRGWRLKALHRSIVSSATYRQASRNRSDLTEIDPQNRLLGRQMRLRMEAEAIRDSALFVSGLLSRKIGGPSVFPYQPEGVLEGRATRAEWKTSEGGDRYRRGMYTYFWRLTPHPFLRLFDAPDAVTTCTRRYRSNTPLQALTLLNDPSFVESAQALARRILQSPSTDDRQRLRLAFRLCLNRDPDSVELQRLSYFLGERLYEFLNDSVRANQAAGPVVLKGVPPHQLAAWTAISRALLNLDEFLTRE